MADSKLTKESLIGRLFHFAATNPSSDAIVTTKYTLSYRQLAEQVVAQINRFASQGISQHPVIGIQCIDDVQHLILCLAATSVGSTSFTIPSYESSQLQDAISDECGATCRVDENIAIDPSISIDPCIRAPNLAIDPSKPNDSVNVISSKINPAGAYLLFATSGTTGKPKLVMHRDSDLVAQAHRHIAGEQERFVCLASIEHNFVKRHRLYCVAMGATNVFIDTTDESLIEQCQSLNVNVMHISAFQAQELLGAPNIDKLSHIRLKLGGSHVPLKLRQQLKDGITKNLQAGYGTTETGAIAFTDPNDSDAGISVGQPLPGIDIRVVSPERMALASREYGELAIRCKGMFRAYLNKEELTAARLADGWFYTGDIGYVDAQQRIYLCGRADDMFVFNSINIYPQDIESQLCQHPDIIDAAVFPKASPVHGNIPVALVVYAKGAEQNLSQLKKMIHKHMGVRSPRQFIIVDEIPRNSAGKIVRHEAINLSVKNEELRKALVQALGKHIKDRVSRSLIIAFERGEKDILLNKIGLDSLARMELLVTLEVDYNTIISPQELRYYRSLNAIVSYVLLSSSRKKHEQFSLPTKNNSSIIGDTTEPTPYIIRLFQRCFTYCKIVSQLNKLLTTFEYRLTPTHVECLNRYHSNGQLITPTVDEKFHVAMAYWLHTIKQMMLTSGKESPEVFTAHRISPYVTHFLGPGSPDKKILLICFAARASRHLTIPNAVLLQHTESIAYDVLMVSEPLNESYRLGVPYLGGTVTEIAVWLKELTLLTPYRHTRTLGVSAGSYPALIAAHYLGSELAISVGGRTKRFRRHPLQLLSRLVNTWQAIRKGYCSYVLMTYAVDSEKDRQYAHIMASISGGSRVAVKFLDKKLEHTFLDDLLTHGGLATYFKQTVFIDIDKLLIEEKRKKRILHLP